MPERHHIVVLLQAWLAVASVVVVLIAILWPLTPRGWPPQRRRAMAWGGGHVAAAFAAFFFMSGLIRPLVPPEALARWLYGHDVPPKIANILATATTNVLTMPFLILAWRGLLSLTETETPPKLSLQRTLREVRLGLQTWLWLTPVVFLANLATTTIYSRYFGKPAEHPLLEPFDRTVPPASVVLLLVTSAVLAAPVCEELLFRGILQPWLAARRRGGPAGLFIAAIVGVMNRMPPNADLRDPAQLSLLAGPLLLVLALVPVERTLPFWPGMRQLLPIADEESRVRAVRAIVSSAAIFANCHAMIWPSPIPLVVLAIGLGWLSARTQGIVAPIVVHMFFNAVAFSFQIGFT